MNEHDDSQDDDSQEPKLPEDSFLHALVRLADSEIEFAVTLSVGGLLISGTIIRFSEYLKLFGNQISASTPELQDEVTRTFVALADKAQDAEREREREKEIWQSVGKHPEDDFTPRYIHLKDAKFFLAADNGIPTQGGTLWRGKIVSVDGFSLGLISATSDH
jgi:hypothetical protein